MSATASSTSQGRSGSDLSTVNTPIPDLVIDASIVSHRIAKDGIETPSTGEKRVMANLLRYALQSGAKELLPNERVGTCLRVPHGAVVDIWHVPNTASAHFGGLITCGSVWMCPLCAAKVSERRREELTRAVNLWWNAPHNGNVIMMTLTLRHDKHDPLASLVDVLKEAWKQVKGGAGWLAMCEDHHIAGLISAFELTHGESGWHPHLHVLLFVRPGMAFGRFRYDIKQRWLMVLSRLGADATWEHGCHVVAAKGDIADYVAKWGKEPNWTVAHELAKSVSKRGRMNGQTPTELLYSYVVKSDQAAGYLWQDYATAMKGRNQLTWTRKLRGLLGMEAEKTDGEVAAEHVEKAILIARLSLDQWRVIIANDARGELLNAAIDGDTHAVALFLEKLDLFVAFDRVVDTASDLADPGVVQLALLPASEIELPATAKRRLSSSRPGCQERPMEPARAGRLVALDSNA